MPMLPSDPGLARYLPARDAQAFRRFWDAGNSERVDVAASFGEARVVLDRMPDVPTRILLATETEPASWDWKGINAAHRKHLDAFVARLPRAEIVQVRVPTPLSEEAPAAIAAAVSEVLG